MTTQDLKAYLEDALSSEKKSQEELDKLLVYLSGGGLAISLVFIREVVGENPMASPALLVNAWVLWGFSLLMVMLAYAFSNLAWRKLIGQIRKDTVHSERPGGAYNRITGLLNYGSMAAFIAGLCLMILFAKANLGV